MWLIESLFQGVPGGGSKQQAEQEQRAAQMEDMKNSILSQALTQEARARREFE